MLAAHPEQLESILHLMHETLQIPLCFVTPACEVELVVPYRPIGSFAYTEPPMLLKTLQRNETAINFPLIRVLDNTVSYIIVQLNRGNDRLGAILAGPILHHKVSRATVDKFFTEYGIPREFKNEALQYYSRQPVMSYRKVQQTALLLHYLAYGKRIGIETLSESAEGSVMPSVAALEQLVETSLSENRQQEFYHHSFAAQAAIFDCVRDGDVKRLRNALNASMDGERGILCRNNPLRNQKNFAICGTALATRSAIEGGLDSEVAYILSDRYIQLFEDLSDLNEVAENHQRMLCEFAILVSKARNSNLSYVVKQCKSYISARLLQEIDYDEMAKHVKRNKQYIAEVFKQETCLTIGEYVQRERIEEAKRMLRKNEFSLLEIALMLCFYDQSHFTRTFKKWCGCTPKQYQTRQSSFGVGDAAALEAIRMQSTR